MTKRKITKRQLLNALLEADEAQKKIDESQARLWKREERLNAKREDLSNQLSNILYDERKKTGASKEPIIYKGHMFDVQGKTTWSSASCNIKSVKSVK